jgi:hypothetical protein
VPLAETSERILAKRPQRRAFNHAREGPGAQRGLAEAPKTGTVPAMAE